MPTAQAYTIRTITFGVMFDICDVSGVYTNIVFRQLIVNILTNLS
jgi:hypothetical protein